MTLTLMTFNLRMNNSGDGENAWPYRLDKAAKVFRSYRPVVVGTQEVTDDMMHDLLTELGSEYHSIGQGRERNRRGEHCAIWYRHSELTLEEYGQFWLSTEPEMAGSRSWETVCPRICTWAKFAQAGDKSSAFYVYNTHLDHGSEQARIKGMDLILQRMRESTLRAPVILMGDFNVPPSDPVIHQVRAFGDELSQWSGCYDDETSWGRTFHGFGGGELGDPIDYIFAFGSMSISNTRIDRNTYLGGYPSDHYPVLVEASF